MDSEIKKEPADHLKITEEDILAKKVKVVLRDVKKEFPKLKNYSEDFLADQEKFEKEKVKKDLEGNFLLLSQRAPKMPKVAKREMARMEIKAHGKPRRAYSDFQCKICHTYLCSNTSLNQHTERHFQPSSYECKKCEKHFAVKTYFEAHKCGRRTCKFCEKSFVAIGSLTQHIASAHADKSEFNWLICDLCDGKFLKKERLEKHLKTLKCQAPSRVFSCDQCDRKFSTKKSGIIQHVKVHVVHQIECEICHAKIKPASFRYHMKVLHGTKAGIKCKICNKTLATLCNLKQHQKLHETRRFHCLNCDKKFSSQGRLNAHKKFHENPDQFRCKICGFQSRSNQNLKFHLRTHDKNREKLFDCNLCDFKTDRKDSLEGHLRFHEKLYEKFKKFPNAIRCEKCPAVFTNKRSFQRHLRDRHGNKEKLKCDHCEYKTVDKSTLKKHLQKHFLF